jgi:hypothetical protein
MQERLGCAAVAILALLGGTAMAEERPPPLRLQQDATVTFRVTLGGAAEAAGVDPSSLVGEALRGMPPVEVVQMHQAATGRTRAGTSGPVAVRDSRAQRMWTFDTTATGAGRVVRQREGEMAGLTMEQVGQDPDFEARRQAPREVAGVPCTDWRLRLRDEPEEEALLACFAADGLVLRIARSAAGMTQVQEAVRVARGPLDPALFVPPPGWPVVAE